MSAPTGNDTLLILADPSDQPVTRNGVVLRQPDRRTALCVSLNAQTTIASRIAENRKAATARLFARGICGSQKLGRRYRDGARGRPRDKGVVSECADLLYHLLVLLKSRNLSLHDVVRELESRHSARP